ncbi:hypothetical protein Lfu02_30300 [Longispora fulva]|uniref:Uncharacterized protein n=1 Tax=Longispora fulva TaxID=619741 RepID=A0A8J7GJA9_9ACTN|nr:hypothetical protein [Longispora fulva]MBG6139166.1 hypothetical protein [Longispora fulva]GIG58658.1 hypothetical protein Lfu02_30300 [Longispora fulva]
MSRLDDVLGQLTEMDQQADSAIEMGSAAQEGLEGSIGLFSEVGDQRGLENALYARGQAEEATNLINAAKEQIQEALGGVHRAMGNG